MKTNNYRKLSPFLALVVVVAAALGVVNPAAAAGPYTVNSTLDEPDAAAGDGICASTPSGACTLRAAIMEANFNLTADTIVLPASAQPYQLTRPAGDDTAVNGDLDITTPVTITGGGAANTIIDGGDIDRVFQVVGNTAFSLSGVTIRNGHTSNGGGGIFSPWQFASLTVADSVITSNETKWSDGAGIYSGGTLVMTNTVVSDNHGIEFDSEGGGLYIPYTYGNTTVSYSLITGNSDDGSGGGGGIRNGGTMTLNYTTVSGNTATSAYGAGGIFNSYGTLTLNYSTVSGNQATSQYAYAGGLSNANGTVYLNNSTVSGNQATHQYTSGAGGIYNANSQGGSATLTNSTVSGNSTKQYGGGIKNDATGVLNLRNATIANNRADSDDSEDMWSTAMGGGISNGGALNLRNTLIAGNVRGAPGDEDPDDCTGTLTSQGYNLLGNNWGCTGMLNGVNGDKVGTNATPLNPLLGPLAFNGGATQTHTLQGGSPAIDSGNVNGCLDGLNQSLASDQRGFLRPVDGDGVGGARCDIGAFEVTQAFYQVFVPVVTR